MNVRIKKKRGLLFHHIDPTKPFYYKKSKPIRFDGVSEILLPDEFELSHKNKFHSIDIEEVKIWKMTAEQENKMLDEMKKRGLI